MLLIFKVLFKHLRFVLKTGSRKTCCPVCGRLGSVRFTVGLDDIKYLFLPKRFYDSKKNLLYVCDIYNKW